MTHHAHGHIVPKERFADFVAALQQQEPQLYVASEALFGIDEARALRARAYETSLVSSTQVFVVPLYRTTIPAQNALLKLLEEPPPGVRFHIAVSYKGQLLPTVASRLLFDTSKDWSSTSISHECISATFAHRLALVSEKLAAEDEQWIASFLVAAEEVAHQQQDRHLHELLVLVRDAIDRPGASKKMLLEAVALALPSA